MPIARYDCITCKVRSCSVLEHCDTETLTAISTYKLPKLLQAGEKLFVEGDPILGVCFIKKGFLKVELNGKQGRPLILRIACKGAIFGHRINAQRNCHAYSATAISEVQYCYIPHNLFNDILKKSHILHNQIINQFLAELELAEKKAVNLAHKSVREKIAEALLLLSDVYQYEEKKQSFKIALCRQDIADLSGTTKEQVSKVLKSFEKEGLVKCSAKKFNYLNTSLLKVTSNNY